MSKHIASSIVKQMLKKSITVVGTTVNILGLTFKENTPDLRNTKVIEVIRELQDFGLNVMVNDVEADPVDAESLYNISLKKKEELYQSKVVVFAVPHRDYIDNKENYLNLVTDDGIIFDIKGIVENEDIKADQSIWRL